MTNENEVTAAVFRGVAEHQVMALIQRYVNEQRWQASAEHYAWGRIDSGEDPVVGYADGEVPTAVGTGRAFADQYVTMMSEFYERKRVSAIGIASAWENFRVSGGRTIEFPRAGKPVDLTV